MKLCSITDCGRKHLALGFCSSHYRRNREGGDMGAPVRQVTQPQKTRKPRSPNGHGSTNAEGYRVVFVDKVRRKEHHVVMERLLNRSLQPWENVHHINGVRDDNRPENLELWVRPQPAGQRASDLAAWVAETYPDLVKQALYQNT